MTRVTVVNQMSSARFDHCRSVHGSIGLLKKSGRMSFLVVRRGGRPRICFSFPRPRAKTADPFRRGGLGLSS
jgi:hypothetical protein